MEQNYLEHHGVLGQKWGVRRYQNFDGSYTKKGLERYNKAKDNYEKKKTEYKDAKSSGKSRYDVKYAKGKMKQAKKEMNKHYNHLKQDKLADKGKVRYANGETITGHGRATQILYSSGTIALGSQYLARTGIIDKNLANVISAGSVVMTGAAYVKEIAYDAPRNKQLRAYYGHTSNY